MTPEPTFGENDTGQVEVGEDRSESERLAGAVLDSLASHIAVLDESGTILAVNESWRQFARADGADDRAVSAGVNYLRICDEARGEGAGVAAAFAAGIRDVLAGRRATIEQEYPCHAPDRRHWFVGRVSRLRWDGPLRVVVSHEEVTERKLAEVARTESDAVLQTFFNLAPALLGVVEIEGEDLRYVVVNAPSASHRKMEPGSIAGRRASEVGVPADLVALWIEKFGESQRIGEPVHFQYTEQACLRPRWMSGIACHLGPSPGGRRRFAYIAQDITENRLAEETIAKHIRLADYGRDVGQALTEVVPMGRMLHRCAEAMVRHLHAAFARIWMLEGAEDALILQASAGIDTHLDGPHGWIPVGCGEIGLIAQEVRSCLTNDVADDPRFHDREWLGREGIVAFAGYPLVVEEKLIGVAAMFAREPISEAAFRTMRSVSNGIALGIERKRAEDQGRRLNEQLNRRLRRTNALRRIDAAITNNRDPGRALALVVEEAISQLGVDAADILICGEAAGVLEFVGTPGIPLEAPGRDASDPHGLSSRVVQVGMPLFVPDLVHAPVKGPRERRLVTEGFVTYHAIPLMAEGRVKGVLECFGLAAKEPDSEWLAFAAMLAEQAAIAIDNAALFEDLRRSNEELKVAYDSTIEGWARALDLRDRDTEGHSRRVTEMTLVLARDMGLREAELVHIRRGALLHDMGKLGVPDAILHKAGPHSEEEWAVMRRHPSYAVEIFGPIEFLGPALDIPHYHHERWDGTGYPCGLVGDRIPLAARIFAAVDIWDALSYDRPYRRAWPQARMREHLRSLSGTQLDPRVVDAFLGLLAATEPASTAVSSSAATNSARRSHEAAGLP